VSKFKTSEELEKIVGNFSLRLFEVIQLGEDKVLTVDFSATDDSGKPFIGGSGGFLFKNDESPREFANKLRSMGDEIDKYWERAFPAALEHNNGDS
jgi:hypothetical protein